MLVELSIKNFAIIDELTISFGDTLAIISGETGAGKSIIIGALALLLGDRANADMIRSGMDSASVEALFDIRNMKQLSESLLERGYQTDGDLVIRRIISRSGKNRIHINGSPATIGLLTEIMESLLSICGQHEHQIILQAENHIDILDTYCGLMHLLTAYRNLFDGFISLKSNLERLDDMRRKQSEKEDLLRFQIHEIDTACPLDGEDEALLDEKRLLTNIQKLIDLGEEAHDILYGRQGSVVESLKSAAGHIHEITKVDPRFPFEGALLDSLYYQVEDAALALRSYVQKLSFDPARLEAVEERLLLLGRLKRKYGPTLEEVLAKRRSIYDEMQQLVTLDDQIERARAALAALKEQLREAASELSSKRMEGAARLKEAVEKEIHALNMPLAEFRAVITAHDTVGAETFHEKGWDEVEFFLTTNVGEDLKPLKRIASGGELSRIVLALKKVLAGTWSVGTIVFDEVDSGIGGATAEAVGQKLQDVSRYHQVICITHLPQIACFAGVHYLVTKGVSGERTYTTITMLSEKERLDEIARMLAGTAITAKTIDHAREMLERTKGKSRSQFPR
jgi:DNA repair protein RecN (Recombination protein N)